MTAELAIDDLEAALLERAKRLADECLLRARQSRDRIIQDENERLRLREEREVLAAKALAERTYRRRVQATELRIQEQLDQLRWDLTQSVMRGLIERLRVLTADEEAYMPVLKRYLQGAAQAIDDDELTAEVNAQDLERLRGGWEAFAREMVPNKDVSLHPDPCHCTGGVKVRSRDNRIQVDNTFEGRMERLSEELNAVILERLFPQTVRVEDLLHG